MVASVYSISMLNRRIRIRLAAEAGLDPRTVERWLRDRGGVSPVVAYALEAASARLGVLHPGSEAEARSAPQDATEPVGRG